MAAPFFIHSRPSLLYNTRETRINRGRKKKSIFLPLLSFISRFAFVRIPTTAIIARSEMDLNSPREKEGKKKRVEEYNIKNKEREREKKEKREKDLKIIRIKRGEGKRGRKRKKKRGR